MGDVEYDFHRACFFGTMGIVPHTRQSNSSGKRNVLVRRW
jgi:hypothetical protein